MDNHEKYEWSFCSIGGAVRVRIATGEDIAHLGELDQKLWTVLSCPVKGLAFDEKTLKLLDSDGDGVIRVNEVVSAAGWLTSVVRDRDSILRGDSSIELDNIDTGTPEGKALHDSARQILANLGKPEAGAVSVADTSDSVAIFSRTMFNGDGVITTASAGEDRELADTIAMVASCIGTAADRSGAEGVTGGQIEEFYAALSDYSAWQAAGSADNTVIFPYGTDTAAALDACEALKDKVADFFMRCKLVQFDADAAAAVDVPVEKICAISGENLSTKSELIATYPLARPNASAVLPMTGINPAWQDAFRKMKSLVLPDCDDGITEARWNEIIGKFAPYKAWLSSKKGQSVEGLGLERVSAILKAGRRADLLSLVEKDKSVAAEAGHIDDVDRLTHLFRDFYKFLRNYVVFADFYNVDSPEKAVFEAGELYIDQRCCHLCIKVEDMGEHADMAKLSGMFLIYCKCVSRSRSETMDILAVMTAGDTVNLRPGKHAVFYDRLGRDWDATVIRIVDNPISIKAAFWSPYRKLWEFCVSKINKSASDRESAVIADMQSKVEEGVPSGDAAPDKKQQAFDIAKFAGIFAAIGMALGYIGSFLTAAAKGITSSPLKALCVLAAVIICISGPSCFIAWTKLRRRNLGPVLNANGWAINSLVLVNILFGGTLTSTARYPLLKLEDPFARKKSSWWKWLLALAVAVAAAYAVLRLTGCTWLADILK